MIFTGSINIFANDKFTIAELIFMITNSLKEDLIRDFQEQKKSLQEQIALVDPMATSLRKPAAKRLFNSGLIIFTEIIMWLLVVATIAFIFLMDKIYPFFLTQQIMHDSNVKAHYNASDLIALDWSIKGMAGIIALLFAIIARMLASIRLKNTVLNITGRNMKELVQQMLHRKAAMETMEQRHPIDLPISSDAIVVNNEKTHNDILL